MFTFKKRKSNNTPSEDESWFKKLKKGLNKTRDNLGTGISNLFLGKKTIDSTLYDQLETQLLLADTGIETTEYILKKLTESISRKQTTDPQILKETLKVILTDILSPVCRPLQLSKKPYVLLMVGVNGAGKTTSIAKIAHHFLNNDKKIILAAGDTFRAAAVEQLQIWGERNQVPVIAQQSGADSAAVIFDAMQSAKAKDVDLLIADTAGRLHTQQHLMNELSKIKRVMKKFDETAPHETMLILDASMGQNALNQARMFHETIGIDSISLTKLDGTAKGGIVFSIANLLQLPFRFIGVGENIDDLQPFTAEQFVEALLEDS